MHSYFEPYNLNVPNQKIYFLFQALMKKKSTIRIKSEISDDELLFTVTFSSGFNKLTLFSKSNHSFELKLLVLSLRLNMFNSNCITISIYIFFGLNRNLWINNRRQISQIFWLYLHQIFGIRLFDQTTIHCITKNMELHPI